MGVYVDIDLDYLIKPVRTKSINNVRLYRNEKCETGDLDAFIDALREKGLLNVKEKKFFTNHRKSYTYWWIKKLTGMTLIHIDAHSDLYRNRSSNLNALRDTDMSCDDYIWYAIRDGFIEKIYWVIPEGLYDLSDGSLPERFIQREMTESTSYSDGVLNIKFKVITRFGEKVIDYTVTTIEKLPVLMGCELLTAATSPEFIPLAADKLIKDALEKLGADGETVERIMKQHFEMPDKE